MSETHSWVIKLGGSLARSPDLSLWLEALAETQATIVPGGGPFADAVRQAQARWPFDDKAAHHMAILAMRQYGLMLSGLNPKLIPAQTQDLDKYPGLAKIWLPEPEEIDRAGIPACWDITSDSLAAWLAGKINADHLLLVKFVTFVERARNAHPADLDGIGTTVQTASVCRYMTLVNQGWVDPVFPEYATKARCQVWLCGQDQHSQLAQGLAKPTQSFITISDEPRQYP